MSGDNLDDGSMPALLRRYSDAAHWDASSLLNTIRAVIEVPWDKRLVPALLDTLAACGGEDEDRQNARTACIAALGKVRIQCSITQSIYSV